MARCLARSRDCVVVVDQNRFSFKIPPCYFSAACIDSMSVWFGTCTLMEEIKGDARVEPLDNVYAAVWYNSWYPVDDSHLVTHKSSLHGRLRTAPVAETYRVDSATSTQKPGRLHRLLDNGCTRQPRGSGRVTHLSLLIRSELLSSLCTYPHSKNKMPNSCQGGLEPARPQLAKRAGYASAAVRPFCDISRCADETHLAKVAHK